MITTFAFIGKRDYKKVIEAFKANMGFYDCNLIFLTTEDLDKKKFKDESINNKFLIFEKSAKENEMIEYLFQKEYLEKVVIFKETYTNFNFNDISKLLRESQKKDVVVSKQNKNENFLKSLWHKIKKFVIKTFLGFNLYDAEADIIALSPLATSIVKQSPNRSAMFCKLNAWSGLSFSTSIIAEQNKVKTQNNTKVQTALLISSSVLLLMIVGHILFATLKIHLPFLALISYILVEIIILFASLLGLTKYLFFKKYGKINFINPANLVKTIDNSI